MTPLEQKLIYTLKTYHKGKLSAIHYKDLAYEFDLNERELRDIVSGIIKSGIAPLCSNSYDGYYWPESIEDVQHSNAEDMSRIHELFKRPKGRKRAWINYQQEYREVKQLVML